MHYGVYSCCRLVLLKKSVAKLIFNKMVQLRNGTKIDTLCPNLKLRVICFDSWLIDVYNSS